MDSVWYVFHCFGFVNVPAQSSSLAFCSLLFRLPFDFNLSLPLPPKAPVTLLAFSLISVSASAASISLRPLGRALTQGGVLGHLAAHTSHLSHFWRTGRRGPAAQPLSLTSSAVISQFAVWQSHRSTAVFERV